MKNTAKDLGRKGGEATLKKKGKKHFQNIANKRWEKEKSQKVKSD